MSQKKRIDLLIVEKGLETSRERAKALIMAGDVFVGGQRVDKAGDEVDMDAQIEIKSGLQYVSRGGLKLQKAMKAFAIELDGKTCMDIGASTGGFTDCMLQSGAQRVFSVDVGYGQLAWKLRTDSRVVNMERTNIRYVTPEALGEPLDFFSVDVSFISLTLVLPVVKKLLAQNAEGICLIKPQFEAGKGRVGKKGVVREPEIHREVIEKICNFAESVGFFVAGLDFSPIKGPEGNIEYLIYLKNDCQSDVNNITIEVTDEEKITQEEIAKLVLASHTQLNGGAC